MEQLKPSSNRGENMENMTFEQAMKRLEEIIKMLEDDQTSLDNSVELFQEGITLSQFCSHKLESVEDRIAKILIDGELKDFQLEEK